MFIDAAHVRAYQHAAGIKDQDIARSIGGNSSKIHLAVDANGNSIELILSDGVTHDAKVAPDLINKIEYKNTEVLYADKGYDSIQLRE